VGRFVVPAPKTYTGTPDVNPAWLLNAGHSVQPVSQTGSQTVSGGVSQGVSGRKHTLAPPDTGKLSPPLSRILTGSLGIAVIA
jgi:hypothetical protein